MARFVLWALRCAHEDARGDAAADAHLRQGFELTGVAGTLPEFHVFSSRLFVIEWPQTVWHHPTCCCMSTEEVLLLQTLADVAGRQRDGVIAPSPWWRFLVPAAITADLDSSARRWLAALERADVVFPPAAELTQLLQPIEGLTGPERSRVH